MGHGFNRPRMAEGIRIDDKEGVISIVLVGSFARGEDLWVEWEGQSRCLSDVEVLAVVEEESLRDLAWRQDIERALKRALLVGIMGELFTEGANAIGIDMSVGFTTKPHLRRLKPHIFTLELKRFGKVIFGDPSVLDLIPDYTPADLSRIDALVLLCNRIVEQLKVYDVIKKSPLINQYLIDKGYIQIVNSLLSFEKRYCPLYPEKQPVFETLSGTRDSLLAALRLNSPAYYDAFTHIVHRDFPDIVQGKALDQWRVLRDEFGKVLCYEVTEILKYDHLNITEAVNCLISVPNLMDCAKGWAQVVMRRQVETFRPSKVVRFIWRTSPQFLIYRDAARLYFSDNSAPQERLEVIGQWQRIVK